MTPGRTTLGLIAILAASWVVVAAVSLHRPDAPVAPPQEKLYAVPVFDTDIINPDGLRIICKHRASRPLTKTSVPEAGDVFVTRCVASIVINLKG